MAKVDREHLRALVQDSNRSARAISLDANLGATAIKDILSGKSRDPGAETLAAIANQLGVTLESLFEQGDQKDGAKTSRSRQIIPRFLVARYRVQAGNWYEVDAEQPPNEFTGAVPASQPGS